MGGKRKDRIVKNLVKTRSVGDLGVATSSESAGGECEKAGGRRETRRVALRGKRWSLCGKKT